MRTPHFVVGLFLACAVLCDPSGARGQQTLLAPAVQTALDSVQRFYEKTASLECDFSQESTVNHRRSSSRGHVTFARPGKMNWVYDDPAGNRIVSDGVTLSVYEASTGRTVHMPANTSQYPAALTFLTGQGRLGDLFNFDLGVTDRLLAGLTVLIGTPKRPTSAVARVMFFVDPPTSQVRRVMIVDSQGNRNRFDFTNTRVNDPVMPDEFRL
jgi:outer membrane lipoprotein carrier protein